MDDISSLLLCSRDVLMLSLYDIIHAVEPVDTWKPEVNLYESGEIACTALQTSRFASKSSALTVSTNQTKVTQGKGICVSAQPVIAGLQSLKSNGMGFLEGKISSCLALFLPQQMLARVWDLWKADSCTCAVLCGIFFNQTFMLIPQKWFASW